MFIYLNQVAEVLSFIFDSPDGRYPSIEELVLCDLFRNIDLREMRGTCIPVSILFWFLIFPINSKIKISKSFKHGLSKSTLSLLNLVRRRQVGALVDGTQSEGSSPCTPPSTPRDRRIAGCVLVYIIMMWFFLNVVSFFLII